MNALTGGKSMIFKRIITKLIVSSLLFTSIPALAVDIPINITGIIQIPPCQINQGRPVEVDFGDVLIVDVENKQNWKKVSIPVTCSYTQGIPYVKVTGTMLKNHRNILATNVENFGIALYQGDGTITKLLIGDGKHNGQDSIGYPVEAGLTGQESGTFTFTAIPYKEGNKELPASAFSASANMSISYF
ncbi:TPA: fimbrial protein [Escherichia coli]|nr:fimbrial protein [Escherichia coli]